MNASTSALFSSRCAPDPTAITRAGALASRRSSRRRVSRKAPRKFCAKPRSTPSRVRALAGARPPALWISTWTGSPRASTAAPSSHTSAASPMSARRNSAETPVPRIASAAAAPRASSRPTTRILAPSRASSSAAMRPIPRDAPVNSMVFASMLQFTAASPIRRSAALFASALMPIPFRGLAGWGLLDHSGSAVFGPGWPGGQSSGWRRLGLLVLVMAAHPGDRYGKAVFVAAIGGAVEQLVGGVEGIQAPPVAGIGVVHDTLVERERAEPGVLRGEGRPGEVVDGVCWYRARAARHVRLRRARRRSAETDPEVVVE